MRPLIESGRIIDIILVLMVMEACALIVYRRRTGRGISTVDLLGNLAAGACLLIAVRIALVGGSTGLLALALAGSLIGHVFDISRRWRPLPPARFLRKIRGQTVPFREPATEGSRRLGYSRRTERTLRRN